MTNAPPSQDAGKAAQIAELEAAIRYWEAEAEKSPPERAGLARDQAAECRERLAALRSDGISDAGC